MVESITEWRVPYCRRHVDCVVGVQVVVVVAGVWVFDEQSKVTHGVAIGSVDKKQVETLCSIGLMSLRLWM